MEEDSSDDDSSDVAAAVEQAVEVAQSETVVELDEAATPQAEPEASLLLPYIAHGGVRKLGPGHWKLSFNRLNPARAPKDGKGRLFTHQCTLCFECLVLPVVKGKRCFTNNKADVT
jgi:hypothetical protein